MYDTYMSTGVNLLYNNVTFLNDETMNIIDIIASKNIVAPLDASAPQNLYLGASKDVNIQALEDVNMYLGSSDTFSIYDSNLVSSLVVSTNSNATTLHASAKDLILGTSNGDVFVQTMAFSTDSNYQILSTTQPSGFKMTDNLFLAGSEVVSGSLSVAGNVICNSNMFAKNYNLFRQPDSGASLLGYAFTINDSNQLELIKYASFSNTEVAKRIAVFGRNDLNSNQDSDVNYVEFNGLGINFVNGETSTPIVGVDGTIADGAITSVKIADSNVTYAKLDRTTVGVWDVSASNNSNIIYQSGSVGIGSSMSNPNSNYVLDIVGDAYIQGTFYSSSEQQQSSDIRLKKDIRRIANSLEKIDQLNGYTFAMVKDAEGAARHAGVIAQELHSVLPEATSINGDGFMTVAYGNIVSLLIEGIKELHQMVRA